MKRTLLACTAMLAAFGFAAEPGEPGEPKAKFGSLAAGDVAPDFTAIGADGKELKLAELRGRVVAISFGATNRPPADALESLATKYGADGVSVLGVCAAAARSDFDAWLAKYRGTVSYPLTWDPAGAAVAERIAKKNFGVAVSPATVVLDREGRMVGGFVGFGPASGGILRGFLRDAGIAVPADELPRPIPASASDEDAGLLKVGAVAPDFTATDVDGQPVKLADFSGKIVVLDFWATWCGPCIHSMPHTQRVAAVARDQGVIVLASCTSDTREKFVDWVKTNRATYPDLRFAHDPAARGEERASKKLYGVNGIPTQFVIGRDGKIAAVFVGYGDGDMRLEQELKKQGVSVPVEK